MGTSHNRIKVADLENSLPDRILITNNKGELQFSDISGIKIDSYNYLDYTVPGKILDARQGKILKDLIDMQRTALELKQDTAAQAEVSASQNAHPSWHGKTVFFKSNVTITIPADGLPAGFTFEGVTLQNCTVIWAAAAPKVWPLGTPGVVPERSIFTFMQEISNSNNIYLFGI